MDQSLAEDLRYFPSSCEVVNTRLAGDGGHTAYYILRCRTPAMHSWGVAKRFSQFCALRETLSEEDPTVFGLPFPAKTWFGGGNDEETVRNRRTELHRWIKGVIEQCPGNREVMMFLADDGSVLREEVGIPAVTPEKQPAPAANLDTDVAHILDTEFAGAAGPEIQSERTVDELVSDLTVPFIAVLQAQADQARQGQNATE